MSPSEAEPDRREDVYVGFTMNEVVRTKPTKGSFGAVNIDYDADGAIVGVEILNAIYVEVDGLRINK